LKIANSHKVVKKVHHLLGECLFEHSPIFLIEGEGYYQNAELHQRQIHGQRQKEILDALAREAQDLDLGY